MACNPEVLKNVPLFALLDDDELAVLAGQVEVKAFAALERIYKVGDPAPQPYVLISGKVRVSTIDEDQQEVVVDEPAEREFFGFASMLEQTPHQTNAHALEESACLEISRDDIQTLLERKPHAGMDLLTTLGRQLHAAHTSPSKIPTETYGSSRRSLFGHRVALTQRQRPLRLRAIWQARCAARQRPTARTRNATGSTTRTGRTGTQPTWRPSRQGRNCRCEGLSTSNQ